MGFQASFIILFCFPKTGRSWTRWWTGIQGSPKDKDSGYWGPGMWNNSVLTWPNWQMMLNCNCERLWESWNQLLLLCNFQLHFWRMSAASNGRFGLAVFRSAGLHAGNSPSQGIVSGKSYLPTKGSRGIQSNIYHLNFGKFERTLLRS